MTEIDIKARNRSRLTLLGLLLLFLLPVVAAIVLHSVDGGIGTSHTVNHGELIRPVIPVGEHRLVDIEGKSLAADYFIGKWSMVYFDSGECDQQCEAHLYIVRQSRLAIGGEKERVQRLMVIADGKVSDRLRDLLKQHPGMDVVTVSAPDNFLDVFKAADGQPVMQRIFLVDPLGNYMMRYPAEVEPKGLIKDMERLIKYSKVG